MSSDSRWQDGGHLFPEQVNFLDVGESGSAWWVGGVSNFHLGEKSELLWLTQL